ncbi:UxaA family hydrolase [Priestia endophytica]|uniref:UxaA family hydrolase n=1 Tax=Priestia endophytica TaxID=135735 RepID=UPI00227E032E|nr:UxaA family hydrolase [Priestia endophytica]MCY8234454.1 UxaA family hydrolase [Priestia endophytica]
MIQKFNAIKLNEADNVAVALTNIKQGEYLSIKGKDDKLQVMENIPYGHKIATVFIRKEEKVIKYGECMGITTEAIYEGYHVHTSNVRGLKEEERLDILKQSTSFHA